LEKKAKVGIATGARMVARARVWGLFLEEDTYLRAAGEMNSNGFAESHRDLRA
jgi:hypothetical protein